MRLVGEKSSTHGFDLVCRLYGPEHLKCSNMLPPSLLVVSRPVAFRATSFPIQRRSAEPPPYPSAGNGRTDYMRERPTETQRPMFQRLARLPHDLREVLREFLLDNGMLGSIVAFALVFGAVMVALVTVILIAGLLA